MSILYINPLPKNIKLIVLNENKEVLFEAEKPKNNDEFSFFPEFLVETVKKYEVDEIWCVVWPGPFTLMRIVTLAINSIAYVENITLRSCNFFDLILGENTPLIEANAREFLIRDKDGNTESVPKAEIWPWTYEGIFGKIDFADGKTFVEYKENISHICQVFEIKSTEQNISPLYFKPPHITCSKKTP